MLKSWRCYLLTITLIAHATAIAWLAVRDSPTGDEIAHYVAGVSHWKFGEFSQYAVNPPLVRLVATAPVAFVAPEPPWTGFRVSPGARSEFTIGRQFIDEVGEASFGYFSYGRWSCIPFSLLGAYVCYRWARSLYGLAAGLLAVLLWCFCPNVLTYGHMITPDVGAAALGVAAAYTFWRWLMEPNWSRALCAGLVLGLCELTKTTWTILFGMWPMLLAVHQGRNVRYWKQLAVILLIAMWLVNLGYAFEGSFTPLREYRFLSESFGGPPLGGQPSYEGRNRFADTWLGDFPVPLPRNYLLGIDYIRWEYESKKWSYLRGEWRMGGWWYYYLYACLIKVPLGTWLLGILAVGMTVWEWCKKTRHCRQPESHPHLKPLPEGEGTARTRWRDEVVLLAPAVVVFVLVSSQTGFNHHLRYVLPAFPFVFIWISKVGRVFERQERDALTPALSQKERGIQLRMWLMRGVVAGALGWSVVSSISVYPHNLSYFNELVGGPKNGHWHLDFSNTDWGQDLLYLKGWYNEHPETRPLHLAYGLSMVDPAIVGIEYEQVPPGPVMNRPGMPKTANWPWGDVRLDPSLPMSNQSLDDGAPKLGPFPGWYVLSVNQIHRLKGDYEYFLEFDPVDWIGYSMMVFQITVDEANRVRRKLGLLEIQEPEVMEQGAENRSAE